MARTMERYKWSVVLLLFAVALVGIVACGGEEAPTATSPPPPTATPTTAPTPTTAVAPTATSAGQEQQVQVRVDVASGSIGYGISGFKNRRLWRT